MSFLWNILPALIFIALFAGWWIYSSYKENKEYERFEKKFDLKLADLKKYNGTDHSWVFVAIKNVIFDVTDSPFYKPGGAYNIFAGTDASVSLAKGDLEGKFLNTYQKVELNEEENAALEDWFNRFKAKYRVAGKVVSA